MDSPPTTTPSSSAPVPVSKLPLVHWPIWQEHVLSFLSPHVELVRLGQVDRQYRELHTR